MRFSLFVYLIAQAAGVGMAGSQPTADEVLGAVLQQPLNITNAALKSYEAEMDCMGVRANFWYQQPFRTALWVMDARDGTPVMAAANGTVAIYDTMGSTVMLLTNQYAGLKFTSSYSKEPGKSGVNFCFGMQGDPKEVEGEILLPPKKGYRQFPAKLRLISGDLYEVQASDTRSNAKTGESLEWTLTSVTEWPSKEVPYRSLEIHAGQFLNLMVKSVNQPLAEGYFQFPMQAMLTSGLPTRRLSAESSQDISRVIGFLMANIGIRHALSLEDPVQAKEAIRSVYKDFLGTGASKQIDKLYQDTRATEKMLSEMTEEQWESTRSQFYSGLTVEEFARRRQDPAFRKELAEMIVAGMSKPVETNQGAGPAPKETLKGMMSNWEEIAKRLDSIDVEALRAKDREIASQLRQAFQLDAASNR